MTAFDTVAFMAEVENTGRLTADQTKMIEDRLQNAHSILSLQIDRQNEEYRATVKITSIEDGHSISVTRYQLPEQQIGSSCGSAVSEPLGFASLANDLLDGIHPIRGLFVAAGLYQQTDQSFEYGQYITQQLLAALTTAQNEKLFSASFPIRIADDTTTLGQDEHAVTLRYWICDTEKSARVVLSTLSSDGETTVFTRNLSIEQLPTGMLYKPSPDPEPNELTEPETAEEPFLGVMSVSPNNVAIGDILAVSAEPPANCNPFFFDLAPEGRLTPLPLNIFDVTEIRPGIIRYDNNSDSEFGIVIQAEDERGTHRLGFICQSDDMTNNEIRDVFKDLRTKLKDETAGIIETSGGTITYNTAAYEIAP
jgi:hypothetical protein